MQEDRRSISGIGTRTVERKAGLADELAAAFAHHQAGRLDRAAGLYRKILHKAPDDPAALHLLGVIALSEGRPERAIQLIGKAVAVSPDFAEAHANLGSAERAAGRPERACASYRRAIALQPDSAPAHSNLGSTLCDQGDFAAALASSQRAVELAPNFAEAHSNLGRALRGLGRLKDAAVSFRRSLLLDPSSAVRLTNLGDVLVDLGRFKDAETCYRDAIVLDPRFMPAHYALAARQRLAGDMQAAIECYRKILSLSPRQPVAWNDLGTALRALGRFDEAVEAFRRALELRPDFADAYRNLANCRQLAADEAGLSRLAGLIQRSDLSSDERAAAGFAMAKALDDADRFDEAFAAYQQANVAYRDAQRAASDRFDIDSLRQQMGETISSFTPAYFASVAGWGNPSERPVFVLGMPRSGTSLVEQIAASHSQVFGAGELGDIAELAAELAAMLDAPFRPVIRRLADAHIERLGTLGSDAERVIDKLPDNVFRLGVIATLFPAARIIVCRRDPRDVCLSCYFQKFPPGRLTFSYDLADCARRYMETERIIAHWCQVSPLKMLEVEYEALIADLEGESRRLIAFLGLDWEPACLEFQRTERTVTTASSWQVRQPLYDRSVGRWRNYQRHLTPLFRELGAAIPGTTGDATIRGGRAPGNSAT
jgi:tetratricopeptide (TPR) repeat protein